MKKNLQDLPQKLRSLGITIAEKTKQGIKKAKDSIENTILEEHLRKRFNLENPYRFQIIKDKADTSLVSELFYRHAKRYEDDDLFVFHGAPADNNFAKGHYIRDLSINADYEIKDIMEVTIPVEYKGKAYDVTCTAVVCELV